MFQLCHVSEEGLACTECHNTAAMAARHFFNLQTSSFELDPAATIGGGSTKIGNYNGTSCSNIVCHGSEDW